MENHWCALTTRSTGPAPVCGFLLVHIGAARRLACYVSCLHMDTRRFSRWVHWARRNELDGLRFPGVYVIAISRTSLSNKRFSWTHEIVYVGMTNAAAGLKGRLKQFDNTIVGKTGHGGADRFRHDYPNHKNLVPILYVAVAPFECKVTSNAPADLITMGDVAKAEYECFAKFARAFRCPPKYNDKKGAPKYSKTSGGL
jgi:hypothetical protein